MKQPSINPEALRGQTIEVPHHGTLSIEEIATRISTVRGGERLLRASKPKVTEALPITGMAAYIWRMVAFTASPLSHHHCMPVTADFDLPVTASESQARYDERYALAKLLDGVADEILKTIPLDQHHGTMRWGRALGAF